MSIEQKVKFITHSFNIVVDGLAYFILWLTKISDDFCNLLSYLKFVHYDE